MNDLLDNHLRFPLQAEMGIPLFVAEPAGIALRNIPVPRKPKPQAARSYTLATAVLGQQTPPTWRNEWQLIRALGLAEIADPELLAGMPDRLAAPVDLFVLLVDAIGELCAANDVALSGVRSWQGEATSAYR